MPAQLPVTKRSVTWRLQLYSAIFGFLLILKLCSVGSAVAEQISVAVGAQAHELVVRERRQIQPDLPICLTTWTNVELRKPITSLRLTEASLSTHTLRRILLAGSAEYFTADGPGGDIIDGVSPPSGQVDAIRCGHLIPSHGWFLVAVNHSACGGPRLMCGRVSLPNMLSPSNVISGNFSANGTDVALTCPGNGAVNVITRPTTDSILFSCVLLKPSACHPVTVKPAASVPNINFTLLIRKTADLTVQLLGQPATDEADVGQGIIDIQNLLHSMDLSSNQSYQLGLVTIRLYDALLRQQPIPAGEMTLLALYESLLEILEALGYQYPVLERGSVTLVTASTSQMLVDVSQNDLNRAVRFTIRDFNNDGTSPREHDKSNMADTDLSSKHHAIATASGYDDTNFTGIFQAEVSATALNSSACLMFPICHNASCTHRLQVNVYASNRYFSSASVNSSINGSVSGTVGSVVTGVGVNRADSLQEMSIRIYFRLSRKAMSNETARCVYWDSNISNTIGGWRTTDCSTQRFSNEVVVVCNCSRLAHFAVIFEKKSATDESRPAHAYALYASLGLSMICVLVAMCLQVAGLRSLDHGSTQCKQHHNRLTILLVLSVNLLCWYVFLLATVHQISGTLSCWLTLIPMHYFNLALFLAMTVEGLSIHYSVVNVFKKEISHFGIKISLFVQGTPVLIVLLCAAIARSSYYAPPMEDHACFINRNNAVWYAGYIPVVGLTLIVNSAVASRAICLIRKLKNSQKDHLSMKVLTRRIRASMTLFFVLGLGWMGIFMTLFFKQTPSPILWAVILLLASQGVALLLFQLQSESMIIKHIFTRMCPIKCVRENSGKFFSASSSSSSSHAPRPPVRRASSYLSSV